jgi:hypothetical protein
MSVGTPPRDGHAVHRIGSADMSSSTRSLEGVVVAIDGHRQRIAKVLDQLDDLQRHAVEQHVSSRQSGECATPVLFALFAQRLRAGDDALRDVLLQLRARVG